MLAPVRWRFFWQMLLVLVGQAVTILLFSWFLRRTYLRYREMDEVLAQHEKLAALGQAASLIAHEVKNSLNGMKAAASMLSADGDRTLPVRTMRGQIDRLSHLATSLLQLRQARQRAALAHSGGSAGRGGGRVAPRPSRGRGGGGRRPSSTPRSTFAAIPCSSVDRPGQPPPQRDGGCGVGQGPREAGSPPRPDHHPPGEWCRPGRGGG